MKVYNKLVTAPKGFARAVDNGFQEGRADLVDVLHAETLMGQADLIQGLSRF